MTLTKRLFGEDRPNIGVDEVADLLSNRRRRVVLEEIGRDTVTLDTLAEEMAAREVEERVDSQAKKRVYVALHQCHLPRMHDYDVVSYDRDRKVVERDTNFKGVRRAKQALESEVQ